MFFFGLAAHNIFRTQSWWYQGLALPGLRCSWHALHISANPTFVCVWQMKSARSSSPASQYSQRPNLCERLFVLRSPSSGTFTNGAKVAALSDSSSSSDSSSGFGSGSGSCSCSCSSCSSCSSCIGVCCIGMRGMKMASSGFGMQMGCLGSANRNRLENASMFTRLHTFLDM